MPESCGRGLNTFPKAIKQNMSSPTQQLVPLINENMMPEGPAMSKSLHYWTICHFVSLMAEQLDNKTTSITHSRRKHMEAYHFIQLALSFLGVHVSANGTT